jgi:hypothetical protein
MTVFFIGGIMDAVLVKITWFHPVFREAMGLYIWDPEYPTPVHMISVRKLFRPDRRITHPLAQAS